MYVVYLYDSENNDAELVGVYDTENEAKRVCQAINDFSEDQCYSTISCYYAKTEMNKNCWWLWDDAKEYMAD